MSDFTTNLSCYATRDYVQALRVIAAKRGTTIGKLVRSILDEALKDELVQNGQSIFSPTSVQSKEHLKSTKVKKS